MPGFPRVDWRGSLDYVPSRVISYLKDHWMVEKGCLSYLAFVRNVSANTPTVEWFEECEESFQKLKTALTIAPMLELPTGSGSYNVYCDASRIGFGTMLMLDGRVIAYESWKLKVHEKNYLVHNLELAAIVHTLNIWRHYLYSVHCEANVVADALSRKAESMGSLAYLPVVERSLTKDVQALANQFVRLDISNNSRVLACVVAQSSLLERIKAHQFDDPHLLVLKDTVQRGGAKEVVIGDDGVM
ncbi:uncharacterized protein [Nicotiana tomentosiformis]|uniref:uncharacterized protein n=1 Tax=Nicotiana tomentosiformis TaxID=4098 RepID=UPI00388CC209